MTRWSKFNEKRVSEVIIEILEKKKINVVKINPAQNFVWLQELCRCLNIKKCMRETFRTNLFFGWEHDLRGFRTTVLNQIKINENISQHQKFKKNNKIFKTLTKCMSGLSVSSTENENGEDKKNALPDRKAVSQTNFKFIVTLKIPSSYIILETHLSRDLFHSYLRQHLPAETNINCVLRFIGLHHRDNNKFNEYAVCRQSDCGAKLKFSSEIIGLMTDINIYSTHTSFQEHSVPLVYQLRGLQRERIKEELKFIKPSTLRHAVIHKKNENLALEENNIRFAHPLSVLHKARSEKLCENDEHLDDIQDILGRMANENFNHPFIRSFIIPFSIHLGCQEQITLLINYPGLDFHFDATKRVFYYCGVVLINKKNFPLLGLITNDHEAKSVADHLKYMRNYWTDNGVRWPPFKYFVTDWSWASINALMIAWNNLTVLEYVEIIF